MTDDPAATFSMTSEPESLAGMRAWLRTELARRDVPSQIEGGLLVAVGELCTNSIKHAYGGVPGQPIQVSVRGAQDRVVIEVEDFGKPFDPSVYVPSDLDPADLTGLPERGMGLFLVGQLAEVSYDIARERGTRWTLTRHRATPRPDTGGVAGGTEGSPCTGGG